MKSVLNEKLLETYKKYRAASKAAKIKFMLYVGAAGLFGVLTGGLVTGQFLEAAESKEKMGNYQTQQGQVQDEIKDLEGYGDYDFVVPDELKTKEKLYGELYENSKDAYINQITTGIAGLIADVFVVYTLVQLYKKSSLQNREKDALAGGIIAECVNQFSDNLCNPDSYEAVRGVIEKVMSEHNISWEELCALYVGGEFPKEEMFKEIKMPIIASMTEELELDKTDPELYEKLPKMLMAWDEYCTEHKVDRNIDSKHFGSNVLKFVKEEFEYEQELKAIAEKAEKSQRQ